MKILIIALYTITFLLSQGATAQEAHAKNNITIKRDGFGTPHIYAQNDHDLFYGYGYVLAEDRLYQLEMLRRSTQGKVAEVLGQDFVAFDKTQRTLFWPADMHQQISDLDDNTQKLFKGFAAGINNRILQVMNDPENLLPFEFTANGFTPEPWTDYDVIMMFVGSMLLRYGDFNSELENLAFLSDLIKTHGKENAWKIFNAVNPTSNPFAPTTIPGKDWQKHTTYQPSHLKDKSSTHLASYRTQKAGQAYSNALVLGPERLKDAKTVLINGPQFGWYAPAYTYSVGFHGPKWDAVGNAPLGYPLPMFGYNDYITWGSTWAVTDNVDIFRETLNPENPLQYKHKGQWKTFRSRKETIKVKGGNDVQFTALNSVHGPVIHMDSPLAAYAKRRGWMGRELETLTGWIEATKAKNHTEWLTAVGKSALNVNWYFADKKGNIGYGSMGAYPVRAKGHDNRLPVSGEGDMDWLAIQPPARNPQILNPSSQYVANWNNKPGAGVDNPDEWWMSWSEADRVKVMDDAVKKAGKMTVEATWNLMMQASFTDPNVAFFKPFMLAALKNKQPQNPRYEKISTLLSDWDGSYRETTGTGTANVGNNGYKHPGNALFRAWLGEMLSAVLSDDLPGDIGPIIANTTGYGTPEKPSTGGHNISVGLKLLFEILQGRGDYDFLNGKNADDMWIIALDKTVDRLTAIYGADISRWHLPVPATRFSHANFLGIPQSLPASARDDMPAMNRGTQNNMTVFRQDRVTGYEVVPPGQSGFIKPNGEKAPHFEDQYQMYQNLQKKRTWLYEKDVDAHTERTYILTVTPPSPTPY